MTEWQAPADLDDECLDLCKALNAISGIRTLESCCGHGDRPYMIWFKPESLDDLPKVLYWLSGCHSGCYGWQVIVYTDCGQSPAVFRIEGPTGAVAYSDSKTIAQVILENEVKE
jgi:hypothetical protein